MDHDLEHDPVIIWNDHAIGAAKPLNHLVLFFSVQGVPKPRPGEVQAKDQRRRLHHGLASHVNAGPGVCRGRVSSRQQALAVEIKVAVRVRARFPGYAERGQDERAGEAFQPVGDNAGHTGNAGQVNEGVLLIRKGAYGLQLSIGCC